MSLKLYDVYSDDLDEENVPKPSTSSRKAKDYTKRAGPLLLGPQLCTSPVKCLANCLARKDGTDEFYTVKILTLPNFNKETTDDIQGKVLLHTEYSLLKSLKGMKGIIQQFGMYRDEAEEEVEIGGKGYLTGETQTRICLVLECFNPHDFAPQYTQKVNLQHYVIKEKRLPESLATKIFYKVVQVVKNLHDRNVVHRDLKLGNIIVDKDNFEVTLTNFGLGKQLIDENEELRDQRGSPAYISPDVISGKPYVGKPSDMWALGVVLYTMLYGQFPFYDSSPTELFRKIKLADFQIPTEFVVSQPTVKLIQSLLVLDPRKRLTAAGALEKLEEIIKLGTFLVDSDLQVVPDFSGLAYDDNYTPRSKCLAPRASFPEVCGTDIEVMLAELANPQDDYRKNPNRNVKVRTYLQKYLSIAKGSEQALNPIIPTIVNSFSKVKDDQKDHEPPTKVTKISSGNGLGLGGLAALSGKVIHADSGPVNALSPDGIASIRRAKHKAMSIAYQVQMREHAAARDTPMVISSSRTATSNVSSGINSSATSQKAPPNPAVIARRKRNRKFSTLVANTISGQGVRYKALIAKRRAGYGLVNNQPRNQVGVRG